MKSEDLENLDNLPKHERRKIIKERRREERKRKALIKRITLATIVVVVIGLSIWGFMVITKESPEEKAFKEEIKKVSLEGKVEEFPIEGRDHIDPNTDSSYKTNPPTSGGHYSNAENWGVYSKEIKDEEAVHSIEHGGIWITYKGIDDESIKQLEEIGRKNPLSTVVSPREANDNPIVIASWGRMMVLEKVDKALIQKYIDTHKNDSPEKIAR